MLDLEEALDAVLGALAAEARLLHAATLAPTIPLSNASATRQTRSMSLA